jgi:hypothetical protein
MHRSGTSFLAGPLQQAGLYLGNVVLAAPHNEKGNRESLEIPSLNDRLLKTNGGSWESPQHTLTWSIEFAVERDHLIEDFRGHEPWGFKDPRTLLTLEFWNDGLPQIELVGTFRHPLAVATSHQERDGMVSSKALDLWSASNSRLLALHVGFPFPIVSCDLLSDDYAKAVSRICHKLGLDAHVGDTAHVFFDPELVHSFHDGERGLPTAVRDTYLRLREVMVSW